MESMLRIWEILIPVIMIGYGIKLWVNPPAFGTGGGLATKYSQRNKFTWQAGNRFGGQVLVIDGVIIGLLALLKKLVLPAQGISWVYFVFMAIELALIFSIVPIINAFLKKKFRFKD